LNLFIVVAVLTPAELDSILLGLDAGLDLALQRAKAWSRYTRDVITYIEKKCQLGDYANLCLLPLVLNRLRKPLLPLVFEQITQTFVYCL
jgi:hypothetical protein